MSLFWPHLRDELFAPGGGMLWSASGSAQASAIGTDLLYGFARDQTVTASCELVGMLWRLNGF